MTVCSKYSIPARHSHVREQRRLHLASQALHAHDLEASCGATILARHLRDEVGVDAVVREWCRRVEKLAAGPQPLIQQRCRPGCVGDIRRQIDPHQGDRERRILHDPPRADERMVQRGVGDEGDVAVLGPVDFRGYAEREQAEAEVPGVSSMSPAAPQRRSP